jgi:hypothetical protein
MDRDNLLASIEISSSRNDTHSSLRIISDENNLALTLKYRFRAVVKRVLKNVRKE